MKLSALIGKKVLNDPEIVGVTADSRMVKPGFLFVAIDGTQLDGAMFIPSALERGAAAIITSQPYTADVPVIVEANPRHALAAIASRFFPETPRCKVGITGTNGKTSTAHFVAELWEALGLRAASIGTLGVRSDAYTEEFGLTTPDPVTLHRALSRLADEGVEHMAMEVSSHALVQARADGVTFDVTAFTNISQDHLDYHDSFEEYFAAKARLFSELTVDGGWVVICADGEGSTLVEEIASKRGLNVMSVGRAGKDIELRTVTATFDGLDLLISYAGDKYSVRLNLIGAFQAENALLAAGIAIAGGVEAAAVFANLEKLTNVPGRMERVGMVGKAGVYVDYAHTPDAVSKAITALRHHTEGRVIAIIGAGGDRDKEKRPLMGRAAHEGADVVIVTDDNPRSENAETIRQAVLKGAPGAQQIGDRRKAIFVGVRALNEGDNLLIAGKGHETGQIVGDKVYPFDDASVAREAIAARQTELGMV